MIIVIDGPAGAGKSSTAKEVARRARLNYVDSGAIYRGFTWLYLKQQCKRSVFLKLLNDHELRFDFHITKSRVFLGDQEITSEIRSSDVNDRVSEIAALPEVRERVHEILRQISRGKDIILEGRDLGTVVFPDADVKFFLTADLKARAQRRYKELLLNGEQTTFSEVLANVEMRDRVDSLRDIAPLKKSKDAVKIDSTSLSFEEQVARIMKFIRKYRTTPDQ
ncbi:MAG: (d)CMP kinase [Balneolales bacterium]